MNPAPFHTITPDDWRRGLIAARARRKGAPERIAKAIRLPATVTGKGVKGPSRA